MKIPLEYVDGRIFVKTTVSVAGAHIGLFPIYFVIDTGSPETFISEGEAIKVNLPLGKFSFEKHTSMGGSKYELNILRKSTTFYFKSEEGKSVKITLPLIKVSKGTKKGQIDRQIAFNFPSIIGTDFLEKNGFVLYCNLKENKCYLEILQ